MTLRDLGEKVIIEKIIKPLFNPTNDKTSIGDDCAILLPKKKYICISTDRVPSDLIAFKLGLIDYKDLGNYLAVLNISDAAASGATPDSLLLNLAFPSNFKIKDLKDFLKGVKKAADQYGVNIVGGDLSDSHELNLTATIIGYSNNPLYRKSEIEGDYIFCSSEIGLTPTAFRYFLEAKKLGFRLSDKEEKILINQFKKVRAFTELSEKLSALNYKVTCMDNTDGISQSFSEIALINKVSIVFEKQKMLINSITKKVADFLNIEAIELIFEAGADFQLIGTISQKTPKHIIDSLGILIIGYVSKGKSLFLQSETTKKKLTIKGWNYYK